MVFTLKSLHAEEQDIKDHRKTQMQTLLWNVPLEVKEQNFCITFLKVPFVEYSVHF